MRNGLTVFFFGASLALVAGCGGDGGSMSLPDLAMAASADMTSSPTVDMAHGPVGPDLGCYANPMSHVEIINACTTATAVDKTPVLPLLNKDGTLPPLP